MADSSNLISAMRNNLSMAKSIVNRLDAGSQHLIAQLDAGVLQGAAYTAGRGLFGELIVPGIVKLGQAVDDVHAELASYEYAHSVVAEHGDLDLDDLTQAVRDAEEQLRLVDAQLETNAAFLAQVAGYSGVVTYGADRLDEAYELASSLARLKEQLEDEIRQLNEKIDTLEWFAADVSKYFTDSLRVMKLAVEAALELDKVAVEVDGSYYSNGVNLALIHELSSAKISTKKSSSVGIPGRDDVYDNMEFASNFSYDKLVEWMSSPDSQTIAEIARQNPGRFRDLLNNALDVNAGNWWSALPGAFNSLTGYDGGATAAAAHMMYLNFRTGEKWDMKIYLTEEYERSSDDGYFYLRDVLGRETRSDVYGNVNYGIMLAHYGLPPELALNAANAKGAAGIGDDDLDDRAVEFGYELYFDHRAGLTANEYSEAIANAKLTDR